MLCFFSYIGTVRYHIIASSFEIMWIPHTGQEFGIGLIGYVNYYLLWSCSSF
jgi:hypothetical protein